MNRPRLGLIITLIAGAAVLRLLPHPPNVAPIAAMALFAGAHFVDRRWAFAVPLVALLATDLILGLHATMPFVYGAFAVTVLMGARFAARAGAAPIAATALASSVLFFIVTNFGTWLVEGLYPHTAAGLAACYVAALPFFQFTLAGDLAFTAVLFGAMALAEHHVAAVRAPAATA
ncbi:MAG: DUF6580 family putative transport protein [Gammaproteobacteria bacterium]